MLGTYYLPYVNQNAELTLAGTRNLRHPEKRCPFFPPSMQKDAGEKVNEKPTRVKTLSPGQLGKRD